MDLYWSLDRVWINGNKRERIKNQALVPGNKRNPQFIWSVEYNIIRMINNNTTCNNNNNKNNTKLKIAIFFKIWMVIMRLVMLIITIKKNKGKIFKLN